jgi:hypothetical protein
MTEHPMFDIDDPPDPEPGECGSCLGYGYFRPNGEPTVDRRERKCMDCGGTGRAPAETAPRENEGP